MWPGLFLWSSRLVLFFCTVPRHSICRFSRFRFFSLRLGLAPPFLKPLFPPLYNPVPRPSSFFVVQPTILYNDVIPSSPPLFSPLKPHPKTPLLEILAYPFDSPPFLASETVDWVFTPPPPSPSPSPTSPLPLTGFAPPTCPPWIVGEDVHTHQVFHLFFLPKG